MHPYCNVCYHNTQGCPQTIQTHLEKLVNKHTEPPCFQLQSWYAKEKMSSSQALTYYLTTESQNQPQKPRVRTKPTDGTVSILASERDFDGTLQYTNILAVYTSLGAALLTKKAIESGMSVEEVFGKYNIDIEHLDPEDQLVVVDMPLNGSWSLLRHAGQRK